MALTPYLFLLLSTSHILLWRPHHPALWGVLLIDSSTSKVMAGLLVVEVAFVVFFEAFLVQVNLLLAIFLMDWRMPAGQVSFHLFVLENGVVAAVIFIWGRQFAARLIFTMPMSSPLHFQCCLGQVMQVLFNTKFQTWRTPQTTLTWRILLWRVQRQLQRHRQPQDDQLELENGEMKRRAGETEPSRESELKEDCTLPVQRQCYSASELQGDSYFEQKQFSSFF